VGDLSLGLATVTGKICEVLYLRAFLYHLVDLRLNVAVAFCDHGGLHLDPDLEPLVLGQT
jgi:hypothetical protein